ncbi:hybrid sensor histidine kinase/response regulator [Ramlibacter sp. PS4R-6]|uniref:hybrid sensor histidine kinase/response regulator n=1 Tax=Ramlibacter sp. PS4R-6 TaxID=3133438 RepID=UPI0030A1F521
MEAGQDLDLATNDLGPLAWVLDELRKSLEAASAALRRFVRDTAAARGTDMAGVDNAQLRLARQQLHQAVGALEMVGLGAPALMLHSMEATVQRFIDKPELCTDAAAAKVERAGFALAEYLEAVLLGKPASSIALFPQYRDVQELAGADRVHPADLWSHEWRWVEPNTPAARKAVVYDPAVRQKLDTAVLKVMKTGDAAAAKELADLSLSLAATQAAKQPKIFWKVCAAYFEAMGLGLLPLDIYVKRAGSRILLQYASLAKGEQGVSDRLAQDLVFFCAQAVPPKGADAAALVAVRQAWGLGKHRSVDYQTPQYGRYDPALLAQARKRVASTKEQWSALSGGDAGKLKGLTDLFNNLGDTLQKLYPQSTALAPALANVVDAVFRSGRPPSPEIAMEVATAVLYLEAALADLDPNEAQLAERMAKLGARLQGVLQGGQPEPLEAWMEELYRRVSDRQTMGSVVSELRGTLSELEKLLDQFFRNLADKAPLRDAPNHLAQMRGVLSVLGLDQAAAAVQRMRDSVEEIIVTEIDEEHARGAGTFDKLGNNLGALGFLIDMLNYQPALAKKLFLYDEATGELRPLMGRVQHPQEAEEQADSSFAALTEEVEEVASGFAPMETSQQLKDKLDSIAAHAVLAEQPGIAQSAREAAAAVAHDPAAAPKALEQLAAAVKPVPAPVAPPPASDDIEEDDLLDIFLEEAREVVGNGLAAIESLVVAPADVGEMTTLRRAFHTLKGSSRMVGLNEFGEAGWAMEQVLNTWLADQKPASDELRTLATDALKGFGKWIEDIAAKNDGAWKSSFFRGPADALRTEGRLVAITLPVAGEAAPAAVEEVPALEIPAEPAIGVEVEVVETIELSAPALELPPEPAPEPAPAADAVAFEISFDAPPAETPPVQEAPAEEAAPAIELSFDPLPDPAQEVVSFNQTQIIRGEPPQAAEIPAAELPPEFDFSPTPTLTIRAEAQQPEAEEEAPAPVPEAVEIEGIDFASLSAVSGAAETPERAPIAAESDDQVKVIGTLRIGIPLYNVYLNEADEWSRRLATELAEWALELDKPVPESAVGIAHALGGSSATVGFHSLSEIARALEYALEHTRMLAWATPQHGKAFTEAAEEIRRLLHQFAAGFLKDPNPGIVTALEALKALDIPQRADTSSSGPAPLDEPQVDFGEIVPEPPVAVPATPMPAAPEVAPLAANVVPMPSAAAQRVVAQVDVDDDEEDIDVTDAVDPDLFPIFEEEAVELLPQMGAAMRQWSARPDNRSARDEVLRALHTLKGSARLAGALRLGELAHRMESHIESLGSEGVSAAAIDPVLHRFDVIQTSFEHLRAGGAAQPAAAEEAVQPDAVQSAAPATPAQAAPQLTQLGTQATPQRALVAQPALQVTAQRAAGHAVRVRAQLLDRLMNQAGEVMITRSRLESELRQLRGSLNDLTGNLDRLRGQLREIEVQAETQMQSRLAQAKDTAAGFDPLEFDRFTRVQELTRFMAESVNDVATVQRNIQRVVESTEDDLVAQARQTRELQRDLLRTRMVEFEGISDRLYRVVRLASKESAKQVKLDITGGSIEMDRGVLDRMTPAFEHLLRNCVAHGIEEPSVRTAAGKDPSGTIVINLHHEGNDVSVEFRDDGAGLNLARIRDKAVQQGLVPAGHELSDAEAAQMIFMPGFSTATQVTELAGRGIGMDVVRAEVNALGGRIETATTAGQGTSFKLVLPLTTAVTQVVMIRAGKLSFGVPANLIEIVRRAAAKEVEQAYNSGTYAFGDEQLSFFWCGALLQASQRSSEPVGKTLPVVVFRSAAQRIAVHVDEILGNQEVVVKNLGPQLARLPGLAGMTALASGAVVLIYNPVALATVYGDLARQLSADRAQPEVLEQEAMPAQPAAVLMPAAPAIPLVLVVDDSITVRRVTQRLLQREGYRVALAADGLQALERLAEEKPTVVLSDIEMPRMDGFDLARNIRNDDRLKDLPIIMITSRIAQKHKDHAQELGVDHYLGKPYSEEELLSLVRHYSTQAVTA